MNPGKTFSAAVAAVPPTVPAHTAIARLALLAAMGALQWGCMETSSTSGAQTQTSAVRMASTNPLCRTQTHLLILDRDAIANGRNCAVPADTARTCRRQGERGHKHDRNCGHEDNGRNCGKDGDRNHRHDRNCERGAENQDRSRDASDRNKYKGGSGSHGGQGGGGGFEDNVIPVPETGSAPEGGGGSGGSGNSGGSKGSNGDYDRKCDRYRDTDPKVHRGHKCDRDGGEGDDRDKVTICHIPPGNQDNPHTIRVGSPALQAHLAHGDKPGACPDDDDGGGPGPVGSCEKSFIGNRANLLAFADKVGTEVVLPAGTLGDEGWFAITTVRIAWRSAGPDMTDGLRNYVEAGPGLGSSDANGNKETLLENIPNVTPLRATGLARLAGRSVCAVVLDGEVEMSYDPLRGDIRGPNLGKVAFQVLSVESNSTQPNALPSVRVRILDADAVCGDPLTAYVDAPISVSPTQPPDIVRPSCAIQQELVSESWNVFDSTIWRGDGSQKVENGLFFARSGAFSSFADWISPCPVTVDTNTVLRFTNRLQLISPAQNEFAESGALFLVNSGAEGSYDKYVFVNVGYTMSPSKVFVELFGSDGGTDFDQYEETNIPFSTSQLFNVDLWVLPNAYHIGVGDMMIDTVSLSSPITSVGLFETGVQQNGAGLRGLIDMTSISKLCRTVNQAQTLKRHSPHRTRKKERLGTRCMTRNGYVRMAKERIKHCANPSRGMQILAKMRERPDLD